MWNPNLGVERHYEMNQTCKVCGEPAAGFHFGAFTCEGCKSFFGRSYNNLSSISECKNNGECVINKKNRTACKACRLRKCLMVGMSKSGSRYGRRSNWFKIHCLLQEQQQQAAAATTQGGNTKEQSHNNTSFSMLGHPGSYPGIFPRPAPTKEEFMMLNLKEYKHPMMTSPSISSPDSSKSEGSIEVGDRRNSLMRKHHMNSPPPISKDMFMHSLPFAGLSPLSMMPPPGFLPPPHLLFPGYNPALFAQHQGLLKPAMDSPMSAFSSHFVPNNNNNNNNNNLKSDEEFKKRFYLDAMLNMQRPPSNDTVKSEEEIIEPDEDVVSMTPPRSPAVVGDNPIDLSMKSGNTTPDVVNGSMSEGDASDDEISSRHSKRSSSECDRDNDENSQQDMKRLKIHDTPAPLDLTAKA